MEVLNIKAESNVMQQVLASLNKIAEAGNEIQVEVLEDSSAPDNSWNDILQNEQLMADLKESIAQAERGECLSADETFKLLFEELGL